MLFDRIIATNTRSKNYIKVAFSEIVAEFSREGVMPLLDSILKLFSTVPQCLVMVEPAEPHMTHGLIAEASGRMRGKIPDGTICFFRPTKSNLVRAVVCVDGQNLYVGGRPKPMDGNNDAEPPVVALGFANPHFQWPPSPTRPRYMLPRSQ